MIELRPSDVMKAELENRNKVFDILGMVIGKVAEAEKVNQVNNGLTALMRSEALWQNQEQTQLYDRQPVYGGGSGQDVGEVKQIDFGHATEFEVKAKHDKFIKEQREFILSTATHPGAKRELGFHLDQQAVTSYQRTQKNWQDVRQRTAVADLETLAAEVQKSGLPWGQKVVAVESRVDRMVAALDIWPEVGVAFMQEFTEAAQDADAFAGSLAEMRKAGTAEAGIEWLDQNTPYWDGTPEKREKMAATVQTKFNQWMAIEEAKIKKHQKELATQFIKDASDISTMPTREAATQLMTATVGSEYYGMAKQYRDALDAETKRVTTEKIERGMTANYSKMKTSMLMWNGNGKPPWDPTTVDLSLRADESAQRITEPEANGLNTLYESTMKELAAGNRKGPDFEDPTKVADMMRVVFQDGPSVTDKVKAVVPFFANGVPPMRWQQIRGMIDEYNGREDWKAAMRPLAVYYNAAIQDPANADKRQALALEQGAATQAMIDVFRKYPDDPGMWKQASDSVMDKNVLPQLIGQVQNQLKAKFPSVAWTFGGISQATQLETTRELAPKEFARSPGLVAQTSMKANEIAGEEKKILAGVGVAVVDSYRDPKTGAWFYSTIPLVRDAQGTVDLVALVKAGNLYQVQETTEGGKFVRKPVKVRLR